MSKDLWLFECNGNIFKFKKNDQLRFYVSRLTFFLLYVNIMSIGLEKSSFIRSFLGELSSQDREKCSSNFTSFPQITTESQS